MAVFSRSSATHLVLGLLLASCGIITASAARQLKNSALSATSPGTPGSLRLGAAVGVCCAFILDSTDNWVPVCDDPTNVPGALPFPNGTVVTAIIYTPGQLAECVGRFPYPDPAPYKLPVSSTQLRTAPGGAQCADQFSTFYEGLGADGSFVVQCTK